MMDYSHNVVNFYNPSFDNGAIVQYGDYIEWDLDDIYIRRKGKNTAFAYTGKYDEENDVILLSSFSPKKPNYIIKFEWMIKLFEYHNSSIKFEIKS